MKMRVYLTFNADNVRQPIIWKMIKRFDDLVVNIRTAEVKEDMGLVALELDGDADTIEKALEWLTEQGVHVEPIEQSVIAG